MYFWAKTADFGPKNTGPAKVAEKQLLRVQQVYDTGKSVRDEFELSLGLLSDFIN